MYNNRSKSPHIEPKMPTIHLPTFLQQVATEDLFPITSLIGENITDIYPELADIGIYDLNEAIGREREDRGLEPIPWEEIFSTYRDIVAAFPGIV
jgi:hypothetical protein